MPGDVVPVHTWMVWHRWEFLMMTSVHPPEMTRFDCLVANFFHLDIRCNCFYNGDSFRNLNGILGFVSPNTLMFFFSSFTSFSFSRSAGLFWPVLPDGLNRKRPRTRGANLGTSKCSVSNKKNRCIPHNTLRAQNVHKSKKSSSLVDYLSWIYLPQILSLFILQELNTSVNIVWHNYKCIQVITIFQFNWHFPEIWTRTGLLTVRVLQGFTIFICSMPTISVSEIFCPFISRDTVGWNNLK